MSLRMYLCILNTYHIFFILTVAFLQELHSISTLLMIIITTTIIIYQFVNENNFKYPTDAVYCTLSIVKQNSF